MAPLNQEQLRAAFEAMAWTGWTFEAAMADPIRRRVVQARAAKARADQIRSIHSRRVRVVRRFDPSTGAWRTQRVAGLYDETQTSINA